MRPDFLCAHFDSLVPEQYWSGCCGICQRATCERCLRPCAACGRSFGATCFSKAPVLDACAHPKVP